MPLLGRCLRAYLELFIPCGLQLVSQDVYDKLQQQSLREAQSSSKNTFQCKTPDCAGWCFLADEINTFKCDICKKVNCITCQVRIPLPVNQKNGRCVIFGANFTLLTSPGDSYRFGLQAIPAVEGRKRWKFEENHRLDARKSRSQARNPIFSKTCEQSFSRFRKLVSWLTFPTRENYARLFNAKGRLQTDLWIIEGWVIPMISPFSHYQDMVKAGDAMFCPNCEVLLLKKWGCDWLRCSYCRTEICWVTRQKRWGPGVSIHSETKWIIPKNAPWPFS